MKVAILALTLVFLFSALASTGPRAYGETLTLTSNPDCVSPRGWEQDRIDCVARGPDNALWHTTWNSGTWSGWESFGGTLTSGPSITSPSSNPDRLDMFARGSDNALWHIVWDGSLQSWESLGGKLTSDPDCTSGGFGLIDCFVRGPNNALWHISFNAGTWTAWESIGGVLTSGPGSVSYMSQGHMMLEASVRAGDNAMWRTGRGDLSQDWSPWEKLGGILTSDPDIVGSMKPQDPISYRVDYVVRGPDNRIWWKWFSSTIGWSTGCQGCDGYESLGGLSNSGPTIVSRAWNSLDVFALGTDNKLYHRGWDGSAWSSWDAVPMTISVTTLTTSSTLFATSSESSISSSSVSTSSMEESSMISSSQSPPTSTGLGTVELTTMLQRNGILILGTVALIVIVVLSASRARHRRLQALQAQQSRTNIFCPNCGTQNPARNEFCGKCGARVR